MEEDLPEPGIEAERTFRVEPQHTTTLFGEQDDPPGLPAAADAADEEPVQVLGTPHALAEVEFLGRESLRGHLPEGTGVVGVDAEVTHRRPVPVGDTVAVRTTVTDVTDDTIAVEGELAVSGSDDPVAEVRSRLRVVRREAFRDGLFSR